MEGRLESSLLCTPRPMPDFSSDSPFGQRKRTPFRVPLPPSTCPPVSRIRQFRVQKRANGPQPVTFKYEDKADVLRSPHYSAQSSKSYLEQCFDVCEKLGEGSFGVVYRVCSRDDGQMYAVKISRQPFRGEWDKRCKLAEVEKHQHLAHHPNCIKFHKAWEEKQKLYIQTELCHMSLSEYADVHGKVPEATLWRMLFDLVKGLKHLHDNQLCHLDIKPANMFLGDDNQTCKLGDFGLCSNLEQGFAEAVEGDSKYLAPELMKHQFGKPADIFSLGISLLELGCDVELPSEGEKWHLLREGLVPHNLTEGLSPELVAILLKMMHPDPTLRPTVDNILAHGQVKLASSQHSCYRALKGGNVKGGNVVGDSTSLAQVSETSEEDSFCEATHGMDCKDNFNRSWIRSSPVRYPSPVYAGPPIPIDFSDSSFDEDSSPDNASSSRKRVTSSPSGIALPRHQPRLMEPKNLFQ